MMHLRNNTFNFFEIILRIMQHKELLLMTSSLCVLSCFPHLKCLPPTNLDTWPLPAVLPYQQMVAGHPRGNTTSSTPTPLS